MSWEHEALAKRTSWTMRIYRALLLGGLAVGCQRPPASPSTSAAARAAPVGQGAAMAVADCPVGDGTNVAVYGFLVRELEDARRADVGRGAVRESLEREQAALANPGQLKPPRASIVERETSHILSALCAGAPGCAGIGLYNPSGHAIALSSPVTPPVGFADDARWQALTSRAHETGALVEPTCDELAVAGLVCDGKHRAIVFAVYEQDTLLGVAMCWMRAGAVPSPR